MHTASGRIAPTALLLAVLLPGCSTAPADAPPSPPTVATTPAQQALSAYEEFWTVTDSAFAAPASRDWTARIEEVAVGQAREALQIDVANYAGVPAHAEGAVTRAPVVQIADLREVQLPSDAGLVTVAWREVGTLVGMLAANDLRAGQTVTPDSVTGDRRPAPGEAVVGLSVEAGRVPSSPLAARDEVLVITGGGSPPKRATIVRAGEADVTGLRSIDVLVPQADAEELALASVEDRVAVVLVGRG